MHEGDIIHLGFYTDKAFDFFEDAKMTINDAWGSHQMRRNMSYLQTVRQPDGEVSYVIGCGDKKYFSDYGFARTSLYCMTPDKFKNWFAGLLKNMVLRQTTNWDHANMETTSITNRYDYSHSYRENNLNLRTWNVRDVYYVYETLLNRKRRHTHYSAALDEAWVGKQRDPIATEMEVARLEEIARIEREFNDRKRELDRQEADERRAVFERITDEFNIKRKELKAKYEKDLAEVEQMISLQNLIG